MGDQRVEDLETGNWRILRPVSMEFAATNLRDLKQITAALQQQLERYTALNNTVLILSQSIADKSHDLQQILHSLTNRIATLSQHLDDTVKMQRQSVPGWLKQEQAPVADTEQPEIGLKLAGKSGKPARTARPYVRNGKLIIPVAVMDAYLKDVSRPHYRSVANQILKDFKMWEKPEVVDMADPIATVALRLKEHRTATRGNSTK